MLFIVDDKGRLATDLLPPTQPCSNKNSTSRMSERCNICQQAATGSVVVACDKCEDVMHLLCAILQTFEVALAEKFDWFSSRPPTEMEESEVRQLYPEVWAVYEEDAKRLAHDKDRTKFICTLCHQGELMKDARTCVMCGDSFGQNGLMIHCAEGRCVKGVHKLCLTGSEKAATSCRVECLLSQIVYKCPTCVVRASLDTRFPENEDFLAGLFVFNSPLGLFAPPRILELTAEQQLFCIYESLRNAQYPEHLRKRKKHWASRWFGAEMNEAQISYEGSHRPFSASLRGPMPITIPMSRITPIDISIPCAPLRRKRSKRSEFHSGRLAGPSSLGYFPDSVSQFNSLPLVGTDFNSWPRPRLDWRHHAAVTSIDELEQLLRDGTPLAKTTPVCSSSSPLEAKTLLFEDAVEALDEIISLKYLVAFVFPALAKEYDAIESDPQDFSGDIRDIFAEVIYMSSLAPSMIRRRKQCSTPAILSGSVQHSRLDAIIAKMVAQKRTPHHLYQPLPHLILLYDQLEAIYGREFFRILYNHPTAFNDYLRACSRADICAKNTESETMSDLWWNAVPLRSFRCFLEAHRDLLRDSPINSINYITKLAEDSQIMRRTMIETNFVITRTNRRFTDDQIYDPLTNPNSAAPTPTNLLSATELICRLQKVFGRFGFMPPLQFESAPGLGLYMRASSKLEPLTILGEYSGIIECRRWNTNPFLAVSDSIYDIVRAGNSNENLCIVPEPYTSIPRYINGINNHIPGELSKVNVFTKIYRLTNKYRCQHLLTITEKGIQAGQQLVLNYNTGISPDQLNECGYPTSHFSVID